MLGLPIESPSTDRMPYHEFYLDDFEPRQHYRPLWEHIRRTGQSTLAAKVHEANLALRSEGVTFTVYSDKEEGIERVWPFDLIPRIIPANEWATIEAGLKQRVRALNLDEMFYIASLSSRTLVYKGMLLSDLVRSALQTDLPVAADNDARAAMAGEMAQPAPLDLTRWEVVCVDR
jgi:uncharacterized circularly permuted ATP-grasp superfamily protein